MQNEIVTITTNCWEIGAIFLSGILTAISTFGAVIYTNYRTKQQLKEQEDKFEKVRDEEFKQSKFVLIRISLLLQTFNNILDRLIVSNDYNRVILLSGDDGFEFYDDIDKSFNQKCRILQIDNNTIMDIKDIDVITNTELRNLDNDSILKYNTKNSVSFLRGNEKILIRITNQEQFENILEMNKNNINSLLNFVCKIYYTTLGNQRITYLYEIEIRNDRRIEIKKDGVESIINMKNELNSSPTVFRNLQDAISAVDRSAYSWEKMGQAQMRGMMTHFSQQSSSTKEDSETRS